VGGFVTSTNGEQHPTNCIKQHTKKHSTMKAMTTTMQAIFEIANNDFNYDVIVIGSEVYRPLDAIELLATDRPEFVNLKIVGNTMLIWY
jgi:hypothetical protein